MKVVSHRLLNSTAGCVLAVTSSAVLGALSVLLYQSLIEHKVDYPNENRLSFDHGDKNESDYPSEIKEELLSRVKSFFGPKHFPKLSDAFVIVVGLGGVGSHAANMLVRSGVGKLKLIDFDQVTLSSLNRHAVAAMSDVGLSKAGTIRVYLT